MSEFDLNLAVGHQDTLSVAWNKRDLLLYAIGIGAKAADRSLINKLDASWTPFPTFPVALTLKRDDSDVNVFEDRLKGKIAPGLPPLDPNRTLQVTQTVETLRPLPAVSGPGWKLKRRMVAVNENKSGIFLEAEAILVDPNDTPYAVLFGASLTLGAKATGKPFSRRIDGPPITKPIPKGRKSDWVIQERTTLGQAIIYRLSGDYNAIHVDPRVGHKAGFGGVILQGLCTYGFAARAVVQAVGGDVLETSIWEIGPGPDGTTEVVFETRMVGGKVCLSRCMAWVKKVERSKL